MKRLNLNLPDDYIKMIDELIEINLNSTLDIKISRTDVIKNAIKEYYCAKMGKWQI